MVHSVTMPSVSGQVLWKEYSWLNRYEQPEHSHPSIRPSCTLNVTLTLEHVIQSPDKCHDKKPQFHGFGKLCCDPYKHLVETVKMCAAWGQAMAVSPGTEEPCLHGRGPLTQHLLCTAGNPPQPLEGKPTGNSPQPVSRAQVLLQFSLLNLWFIQENGSSKFTFEPK